MQAAKFGAKLNYIRQLNGKCPDGYEMQYFKQGGQICKKCIKKAMMEYGGTTPQNPVDAFKCGRKMKKKALRIVMEIVSAIIMVVTVVGRLLSGVHWLTDILGALLLSATLISFYYALVKRINKYGKSISKKKKTKKIKSNKEIREKRKAKRVEKAKKRKKVQEEKE